MLVCFKRILNPKEEETFFIPECESLASLPLCNVEYISHSISVFLCVCSRLTAGLLTHPSLIRIDRPSGVSRGLLQLGCGLLLESVRSGGLFSPSLPPCHGDKLPSPSLYFLCAATSSHTPGASISCRHVCSLSRETTGEMLAFSPVTTVTSQPWLGGARGSHLVVDGQGSWMGVLATYSTLFVPLTNSLHSRKALKFFLWVRPSAGRARKGGVADHLCTLILDLGGIFRVYVYFWAKG